MNKQSVSHTHDSHDKPSHQEAATAKSAWPMVSIHDAVSEADPALLLAATVSVTGRNDRIAEFLPYIATTVVNYRLEAQMLPERRMELDAWAVDVFSNLTAYTQIDPLTLDDETFQSLAQSLVGISVEPESIPFLREQAGFTSLVTKAKVPAAESSRMKVAIIGAGMAGVATAVAADKAGFDFEVLEKNDGVGGVWLQNRYAGVGVDTPCQYYSLSFEINPAWTNAFPQGDEFREYLDQVAHKYGVIDKFTFNAEVTDLVWDEHSKQWNITYVKGDQILTTSADAVVTAAGYLTRPALPAVPGLETFKGHWCHAAEWRDDYDFTGKRLAVVGTGCTSVQVVDALAPVIESLTLFQRQPHWVTPSASGTKVPETERWLLMNVPSYANWARLRTFLIIGDANYPMVRYDEDWAANHDVSISQLNDVGMQMALGYLNTSFADQPALLEKLKPDFAFMGKRPIRDPGAYYETLKKSTSNVVTSGLAAVRPNGLVDGEGELHEVDAVIYATGFSLEFLRHWNIVGRDGVKLRDKWAERPSAYLGCQVTGFPNLFVTSGPNANPSHGGGHNFCVEATVHYVIESLRMLSERGAQTVEPKEEAMLQWQSGVDEALADSVWVREKKATTYYRNASGDVVLANPFKLEEFWRRLRKPDLDNLIVK
jgi:cation diffusion facilitator CzcD-associated flavoprotein CzcO